MTELMQRPAGLRDEQLRGAAIGQPRVAGQRAEIPAAGARAGIGRRLDRNTGPAPALDEARQQPSAPGAEEQLVDAAALRARAGALGGDVEILDIEAQDFVAAGSGLIEQPPERAFAQVDVASLLGAGGPQCRLLRFVLSGSGGFWA
jgi:hypothetical protein